MLSIPALPWQANHTAEGDNERTGKWRYMALLMSVKVSIERCLYNCVMNENTTALQLTISLHGICNWNLKINMKLRQQSHVKSAATWQHWFDVNWNLLSYPAPLSVFQFHPKCNQFIFWGLWLSPQKFIKICSILRNKKPQCWHKALGQAMRQ